MFHCYEGFDTPDHRRNVVRANTPSDTIVTILDGFRPKFTRPTWNKVLVMI